MSCFLQEMIVRKTQQQPARSTGISENDNLGAKRGLRARPVGKRTQLKFRQFLKQTTWSM